MLKIRKIVCTAFMTLLSVSLTLVVTYGVSHAGGGTVTGTVTVPLPKFKKIVWCTLKTCLETGLLPPVRK